MHLARDFLKVRYPDEATRKTKKLCILDSIGIDDSHLQDNIAFAAFDVWI